MKKLLLLKHWQLFLLTYGVPILMQFVMMGYLFWSIENAVTSPGASMIGMTMGASFISALFAMILFAWLWAMGTGLVKKLPEGMQMNFGFFKFAMIFPITYFLLVFLFVFLLQNSNTEPSPWFALIIIPHLFTMFCIFYIFYFNAKALKSVEFGREARVGDYIGEFFLMWFLFIGIWFIQPRLNKLFAEGEEGMERHLVE